MNPGKLKDRAELLRRNGEKNAASQITYTYTRIDFFRGNFRSVASADMLADNMQVNVRSGTLRTRYYPNADENLFIKLNDRDIYSVKGVSHNDDNTESYWALEYMKVPKNGETAR